MRIDNIVRETAMTLGQSLDQLNQRGDSIRADRHRGFMANEPWKVAPNAPLHSLIDHTVLKPEATVAHVLKLCSDARQHSFPAVCVNPVFAAIAAAELAGSGVRVATVVGFPLGASASLVKAVETTACIAHGASEVDMVIHVGALKAGNLQAVLSDVAAVVNAAGTQALVKVILETGLLTGEEIVQASLLSMWAGADFVKTSTGFSTIGATVPSVALMREVVGDKMGVKAAGGIRDAELARAMVAAGASRIGTSSGPRIVAEQLSTER